MSALPGLLPCALGPAAACQPSSGCREKLNGLLIDSFQALRPCPDTAAGLNELMGSLKSFAQKQKLHLWLVVHTLDRAEADYLLTLSDIGITLQRGEEVRHPSSDRATKACCVHPESLRALPGRNLCTRFPAGGAVRRRGNLQPPVRQAWCAHRSRLSLGTLLSGHLSSLLQLWSACLQGR